MSPHLPNAEVTQVNVIGRQLFEIDPGTECAPRAADRDQAKFPIVGKLTGCHFNFGCGCLVDRARPLAQGYRLRSLPQQLLSLLRTAFLLSTILFV